LRASAREVVLKSRESRLTDRNKARLFSFASDSNHSLFEIEQFKTGLTELTDTKA
jgi:hypothetical protein